jgi:probable DNA metabolism protein
MLFVRDFCQSRNNSNFSQRMRSVDPGENFATWRVVARVLLAENAAPDEVLWESDQGLFSSVVREEPAILSGPPSHWKVPAAFVSLAESVACHHEPQRWGLLYQILWRVTWGGERHLLSMASDPAVAKARILEKNVHREIHKMHAFVRFKCVETAEPGARERYVAWFEPENFIVEASAPFFRKRFANMDWSIFTPKGCVHWDGLQLSFTPGITHNPVEDPDALEAAWRVYYRSIFNPARLKVKAMQTEMPKRYWKNLPEADLIEELISQSGQRVGEMLAEPLRPVKPRPKNAYLDHLQTLSKDEPP